MVELQPSEQLYGLTEKEEGYRQLPYKDIAGNWTVGIGHLIRPGENFSAGISLANARVLLHVDMGSAAAIVNREVSVSINQGEFDALCDFVFNLGDRLKSSTLLRLLNAGQTAAAEQQLLAWDYAGGKPCAALKTRRVLEMDLWSRGDAG